MRIINDSLRIWQAENDPVLAGAADATKRETERGVMPVGILVPLDAANLDALCHWAKRTGTAAEGLTARQAAVSAILDAARV